jgi:hypothetical protein
LLCWLIIVNHHTKACLDPVADVWAIEEAEGGGGEAVVPGGVAAAEHLEGALLGAGGLRSGLRREDEEARVLTAEDAENAERRGIGETGSGSASFCPHHFA